MSSLGAVFDIAKSALAMQRYGLDVTAHNIANVNTPGYSRQSPVLTAKQAESKGGLIFGRGVDITQVIRASDQFIEDQLMQQKSSMLSSKEMENYMQVLEGVFNENPETSISAMLSDFWNLWHDISNNPSGVSERTALYEHGILLAERFNALDGDLASLETDLTNSLSTGIDEVNRISNEIAQLNDQIPGLEAGGNIVNDLRDKRNIMVSELSEYLDVNSFEQDNGTLTVVTARGCILVHGDSSYDLEMGGVNGDRVKWQASGGTTVDITNYISNGKLGGWLDMRDEVVAKYKLDISAVAEEFIWAVNSQHSQGVGLEAFSTVTGAYQASDTNVSIDSSGLSYADEIVDGDFKLWLYDSNGTLDSSTTITVDADVTTIDAIVTAVNAIGGGANISATTTTDGKLQITSSNGFTFAFSDDTSNVLASLGVNTFFKGASASGIDVTDTIGSDKNLIAAARIAADGSYASGDNTNALAIADLQYTSMDIPQWTCDRINGDTESSLTATIENYYHSMVGSVGITSAGIARGRVINEDMVKRMTDIRDSISAVSLDEEMTNLIKFQQAYAAASRLISVADEMLDTLLSVK